MDRVLVQGFAHEFPNCYDSGLLKVCFVKIKMWTMLLRILVFLFCYICLELAFYALLKECFGNMLSNFLVC